jgi:hypothetical protein
MFYLKLIENERLRLSNYLMELEMSIFGISFWSRLYHGRWDLDW